MIVLAKYKRNYLSTQTYHSFSRQQNKTNNSLSHTQPPRSRSHSFVGTESIPPKRREAWAKILIYDRALACPHTAHLLVPHAPLFPSTISNYIFYSNSNERT